MGGAAQRVNGGGTARGRDQHQGHRPALAKHQWLAGAGVNRVEVNGTGEVTEGESGEKLRGKTQEWQIALELAPRGLPQRGSVEASPRDPHDLPDQ